MGVFLTNKEVGIPMLDLFILLVFLKKDTIGFGGGRSFCAPTDKEPLQTIPYHTIAWDMQTCLQISAECFL